jgi:hypothetical protein
MFFKKVFSLKFGFFFSKKREYCLTFHIYSKIAPKKMMIITSLAKTCIGSIVWSSTCHYENNVPYEISSLITSLLSSNHLHEYEKAN